MEEIIGFIVDSFTMFADAVESGEIAVVDDG